MSDVFISYAREDLLQAEAIAAGLEKEGWSVWWDRTIPTGRDFAEVIEEAISSAKCVVVLWSSYSVKSRWVQTEAAEGANRHILMPVLVEDVKVPFEFRRIQAADFNGWEGQLDAPAFRRFVRDVSHILGLVPRVREPQNVSSSLLVEETAESARHEEKIQQADLEEERQQAEVQARQRVGADRLRRLEERLRREAEDEKRKRTGSRGGLQADAGKHKLHVEDTTRGALKEEPGASEREAGCWWLLPLLPLLGARYAAGEFLFELCYFAIPVAAWVGQRYRRKGLTVLAIGLLPLFVGLPDLGGFSLVRMPYLYLVSLIICWGFADPGRWWRRLSGFEVTTPFVLGLFIVGGAGLGLFSYNGGLLFGWRGNIVLIALGAFIIGLTGKGIKTTVVAAIAFAAVGASFHGLVGSKGTIDDLGEGMTFGADYAYGGLAQLLLVLVLLRFGRMVGDALRVPRKRPTRPSGWSYLSFALLWLASTHVLRASPWDVTLLGEAWLTLGLAFVAGMGWQRGGLAVVGIALSLTLLEAVFAGLASASGWIGAGGIDLLDTQLILKPPQLSGQLGVYLAVFAFWELGCRFAEGLEFEPVLQAKQSPLAKWGTAESVEGQRPTRRSGAGVIVPWLLVPLMPMLTYYYQLSRDTSLRFELLIVPFCAWLAYRYGRSGFIAFAVGGVTYCFGLALPVGGFLLSPDWYFTALFVGWVVVQPERAINKLTTLRLSNAARVAVMALLTIGATMYLGDLQLGLPSNKLFPLALLVLGWAGAPLLSTVGLITCLGILGSVVKVLVPSFDFPGSVWYWPNSIEGILYATVFFLGGLTLRHLCAEGVAGQQEIGEVVVDVDRRARELGRAIADWSASPKGFIGFGVLMLLALVQVSVGGFEIWHGDDYFLMFVALMASTLLGARGIQLTFGIVALLSLVIVISRFAGLLQYGFAIGPLVVRIPTRTDTIFPLVVFSALLYALLGTRLAAWLAERSAARASAL